MCLLHTCLVLVTIIIIFIETSLNVIVCHMYTTTQVSWKLIF